MRAVFADQAVVDTDRPTPAPGEALIQVVAAGINRADLLQVAGHYDPPPGSSPILGLEVSGTIADSGDTEWAVGTPVCALLSGGGYAEYVAVPGGQILPLPDGIELADAAALPEVAATVWSNLIDTAHLAPGEHVLIHGGASGIGTHAIQLAKAIGCEVTVTASASKLERCLDLGADHALDYRTDTPAADTFDVILDIIGARNLEANVTALRLAGRLVIIGMQGGTKGTLDIATLLRKRGTIHATNVRGRDRADKARIIAGVRRDVWPLIASGAIVPIISQRFPLAQVADAHATLNDGRAVGKVLLDVGSH